MKVRFIFFAFLFHCIYNKCYSQYIGVRASYAGTRLVGNSPLPPSREDRLILSFFTVDNNGAYTPVYLSNYDIYIYKQGLQYGSYCGGVVDSCGNNYAGYHYTAPKAVAYFNSLGLGYIDCDNSITTHYVVNGQQLDCGYIQVSHWEEDPYSGQQTEYFSAPNVCLHYYQWPELYYLLPGNLNFTWPVYPTAPYNWYSFACYNSTQQLVIRGVIPQDSSSSQIVLPITFSGIGARVVENNHVKINWSNETESDIRYYVLERSFDGILFQDISKISPLANNGGKAEYETIDNTPYTGKNFYRIKAVENNGDSLYSNVVAITIGTATGTSNTFDIYPNPVKDLFFNCRLSGTNAGTYKLELINVAGQQRYSQLLYYNGGMMVKRIDLPALPAGIYYVELHSATQVFSQKLAIQN